jgi:hypothetical protein
MESVGYGGLSGALVAPPGAEPHVSAHPWRERLVGIRNIVSWFRPSSSIAGPNHIDDARERFVASDGPRERMPVLRIRNGWGAFVVGLCAMSSMPRWRWAAHWVGQGITTLPSVVMTGLRQHPLPAGLATLGGFAGGWVGSAWLGSGCDHGFPPDAEGDALDLLRCTVVADTGQRTLFDVLAERIAATHAAALEPEWVSAVILELRSAGVLDTLVQAYAARDTSLDRQRHRRDVGTDLAEVVAWVIRLIWHEVSVPLTDHHAVDVDLRYRQFVLPNGVRVVVQEDADAGEVSLQAWHGVGGRNDPPGKSGLAHVVEHALFEGNGYQTRIGRLGGTASAQTNKDYTVFTHELPPASVGKALGMHAARIRGGLDAVDDAMFGHVRRSVLNEYERRNSPYFRASQALVKALYPSGHPYHDSDVIGSPDRINALSLEDARMWMGTAYRPADIVLVLVGNVDARQVREQVIAAFGDFPAMPAVDPEFSLAPRPFSTAATVVDDFAAPGLLRAWHVPARGHADIGALELFAGVLSERLASRVPGGRLPSVRIEPGTLSSLLIIDSPLDADTDPVAYAGAVDRETRVLLRDGPDDDALGRARETALELMFLDGVPDRAEFLGQCAVLAGDPDCVRLQATASEVRTVARRWLLGAGSHTLYLTPTIARPVT